MNLILSILIKSTVEYYLLSRTDLIHEIEQKGENKSHYGTEDVNQLSCSFLRTSAVSGSSLCVLCARQASV